MSGMYGADVAELRSLATQFDRHAQQLDAHRLTVGKAIQVSAWIGPVAVRFRHQWDSQYSRQVHDAATRLHEAARDLRDNADEQDRASAAGGVDGYAPYSTPTDVRVSRAEDAKPDDVPRGAGDPAEVIREFARPGTYQSGVSIRTITHADGTRSHIVYIPGTQDWFSLSDNVFDGTSNIPAYMGGKTKAERAILEALKQHGISADEPILLAGHSQGGLLAANLAADPEFRKNYHVGGVLTYGATVEDREIPAEIPVTQVRNRAEIVTHVTDRGWQGVQNLNRIDFTHVDIQTPHAQDESFFGRFTNAGEAMLKLIKAPVTEHIDTNAYASNTYGWYGRHQDEWEREYSDFGTDSGSTSSMSRYSFAG